jgi:hypothetical protein
MRFAMKHSSVLGVVVCGLLGAAACGGGSNSPTAPTSSSGPSTTGGTGSAGGTTTTTSSPVAYVQDVKPILDADCTRCHGTSRRDGGVDLSTYSSVLRVASAGNASSQLVRATRSGASMYNYLSGDRATKAELIRAWVVDNAARESR